MNKPAQLDNAPLRYGLLDTPAGISDHCGVLAALDTDLIRRNPGR